MAKWIKRRKGSANIGVFLSQAERKGKFLSSHTSAMTSRFARGFMTSQNTGCGGVGGALDSAVPVAISAA